MATRNTGGRLVTPHASPGRDSTFIPHGALAALARNLEGAVRMVEPLSKHTSLRVGGQADVFLIARTTEQLMAAVERASFLGIPWRVIGAGSNLLVADGGVEGLVVKAAMVTSSVEPYGAGAALLHAEAGCLIASLAKRTASAGWAGLEWAVNLPGTVGAAVVNNSGAFGSCVAERLAHATLHVPDRGRRAATATELEMDYRTSRLKRGDLAAVVLGATFRLVRAETDQLLRRIDEIQHVRRATQPGGSSLGSIFANPDGDAAGRLIEDAGLKGGRFGGAEVSRLHGNFIMNRNAARASDVLGLMQHVQRIVWARSGRWLTPEVQLVGRWRVEEMLALAAPPGDPA